MSQAERRAHEVVQAAQGQVMRRHGIYPVGFGPEIHPAQMAIAVGEAVMREDGGVIEPGLIIARRGMGHVMGDEIARQFMACDLNRNRMMKPLARGAVAQHVREVRRGKPGKRCAAPQGTVRVNVQCSKAVKIFRPAIAMLWKRVAIAVPDEGFRMDRVVENIHQRIALQADLNSLLRQDRID